MKADDLTIMLRAYTTRGHDPAPETKRPRRRPRRRGHTRVLVFDMECTLDPVQGLTFGSYQYYRRHSTGYRCVEEGLIHADDLETTDRSGFAALRAYVEDIDAHPTHVAKHFDQRLKIYSLRQFLARVFWPAAYEAHALVVGFNLPFDLSRIAVDCGEARGFYRGGFSFQLWEYRDKKTGQSRESRFDKPRLCIRHLDSKRAFIGFARTAKDAEEEDAGHDQ